MSSLPPAFTQYVQEQIAQAIPDINTLAAQASQTAEASLTAGISAILNSRTAQLQKELADATAAIRAEAVQPPIDINAIASLAAQYAQAQIGSGIQAIVEQATAQFRADLAKSISDFQEQIERSVSQTLAAIQYVAELENELRDWTDRDRYELTRAQITKIMRELNV